jgi:glutaredoxin-dependent peroxiredoxin
MTLKVGNNAPDFTLKSKNLTGEVKDYSLKDYKGKNIVLLFFPQAFTGVCTNEMCTVSEGFDFYSSLDAVVLGISVDSIFTQEAWAKQNHITIPLLSDFNKEIIEKYGTRYPDGAFAFGMNGVSKRSAFVIDKQGIIRHIEILEDAGKLPDFNKIKEVLKSL